MRLAFFILLTLSLFVSGLWINQNPEALEYVRQLTLKLQAPQEEHLAESKPAPSPIEPATIEPVSTQLELIAATPAKPRTSPLPSKQETVTELETKTTTPETQAKQPTVSVTALIEEDLIPEIPRKYEIEPEVASYPLPTIKSTEQKIVQKQAELYVKNITLEGSSMIDPQKANHFISSKRLLLMVTDIEKVMTITSEGQTPVVISTQPSSEIVQMEVIDSEIKGQPITLALLAPHLLSTTTPAKKAVPVKSAASNDELLLDNKIHRRNPSPIKPSTKKISLAAATNEPLNKQNSGFIDLTDLFPALKDKSAETIFFVRTVNIEDESGLWGIILDGLINNFARGMDILDNEQLQNAKLQIPYDADQLLKDRSSSFLGRLIHNKTKESYVYNFQKHRIGNNANYIYPGQELVIVNFTSNELISIFKHFANLKTPN